MMIVISVSVPFVATLFEYAIIELKYLLNLL